jgi:glutathione S-transferase
MKIYGDAKSGNCYKIQLLCALLELEYEWVPIDILQGETRTGSFLTLNPNGQIPVCVTDAGEVLTESNAILFYLARDSRYWPDDRLAQTRVLEWQFFEQYNHEPSVAVARFIKFYQQMPENRSAEYQLKLKAGYRALDLMERHLDAHEYFVAGRCSIADISLYAYTHVAHEGGFELSAYPGISAWIARIQRLDGYVGMTD